MFSSSTDEDISSQSPVAQKLSRHLMYHKRLVTWFAMRSRRLALWPTAACTTMSHPTLAKIIDLDLPYTVASRTARPHGRRGAVPALKSKNGMRGLN
ncbi:hypothetical protein IF2G_10225 [Cordyceps javanica]|nr:hypothetical protein IF2G_10225 [Cordyceps javanica]